MESPAAPPPRSRSRRSIPSLHKLNIAPLSSADFPLDTTSLSPVDNDRSVTTPHASYIQGRSAPTTPGILSLSRSTSRHRRHRNSRQGYTNEELSYFSSTVPGSPTGEEEHEGQDDGAARDASSTATTSFNLPKAKSSSALLPTTRSKPRRYQPVRPLHEYNDTSPTKRRHHKRTPSTDWLYRAGLAIASEARETKGQSWLVSRDSSTSIAHMIDEPVPQGNNDYLLGHSYANGMHRHSVEPPSSSSRAADDERGFGSPMTPRWGSRTGSRAGSRLQSRRGSKVMIAAMSGTMTPRDDYYGYGDDDRTIAATLGMEPDFVDGNEGEDSADGGVDGLDEEEIARLASERGFGLGGWMDRLVSWTLFKVAEDGEESEMEADEEDEAVSRKRIEQYVVERSRVRPELVEGKEGSAPDGTAVKVQEPEEEGGWKDAAWLLSVASKVLF